MCGYLWVSLLMIHRHNFPSIQMRRAIKPHAGFNRIMQIQDQHPYVTWAIWWSEQCMYSQAIHPGHDHGIYNFDGSGRIDFETLYGTQRS